MGLGKVDQRKNERGVITPFYNRVHNFLFFKNVLNYSTMRRISKIIDDLVTEIDGLYILMFG